MQGWKAAEPRAQPSRTAVLWAGVPSHPGSWQPVSLKETHLPPALSKVGVGERKAKQASQGCSNIRKAFLAKALLSPCQAAGMLHAPGDMEAVSVRGDHN